MIAHDKPKTCGTTVPAFSDYLDNILMSSNLDDASSDASWRSSIPGTYPYITSRDTGNQFCAVLRPMMGDVSVLPRACMTRNDVPLLDQQHLVTAQDCTIPRTSKHATSSHTGLSGIGPPCWQGGATAQLARLSMGPKHRNGPFALRPASQAQHCWHAPQLGSRMASVPDPAQKPMVTAEVHSGADDQGPDSDGHLGTHCCLEEPQLRSERIHRVTATIIEVEGYCTLALTTL